MSVRLLAVAVAIVLVAALAACGSSAAPAQAPTSPTPPASPAPAPTVPNRITIRRTGMNPPEISIAAGSRITFINEDTLPHDMAGGPDPAHPDCREIDAAGFIVPGQSRQTDVLPNVRTCEYHDHSNHSPLFTGRIIIR